MEKQPVYEEVKLSALRLVATAQAVVETRLLPQPSEEISRVLSITAESIINSTEAFTGEVRFGGRVDFKVLYVDNSGSNHVIGCSAEFSDKIEANGIKANAATVVEAAVIDTDVLSLKPDEIKLAGVVEIKLNAVIEEDLNYLASGGEDVYTRDEKIEYSRFIASGKAVFTEDGAVEKTRLINVLLAEHRVIITSASAERDVITVGGIIVSDVCGETEEGLLHSARIEAAFTEEVAAADVRAGDYVITRALVNGDVRLVEGENGNDVEVSYSLEIKYFAFAAESKTVVTDAFLPTHELLPERRSIDAVVCSESVTVTERIEGSVTLDGSMPVVDSVLATTGMKLTVTNAKSYDGEALIEGIVGGNVLYYSAEENRKCSVLVELPFSVKISVGGTKEGDQLFVCGTVSSVTTKIRRGNEIDVRTDVTFRIDRARENKHEIITALAVGEPRELPTAAISVYVASSKETLWEVAKALGTTPELIIKQNPTLQLPLSGGERIMLFRHLDKN